MLDKMGAAFGQVAWLLSHLYGRPRGGQTTYKAIEGGLPNVQNGDVFVHLLWPV
jgi:hypothetical protein